MSLPEMQPNGKRIAILYSELAGYTLACLKALKTCHNASILLVYWKPVKDAPFEFDLSVADYACEREKCNLNKLKGMLDSFDPHVIYISGWMDRDYLRAARYFRTRRNTVVVSGLDGQWSGSFRQQALRLIGKKVLKKSIDVFWVTGERQAQMAARLGYRGKKVRYGLYCCDWDRFASIYYRKKEVRQDADSGNRENGVRHSPQDHGETRNPAGGNKNFLYTGRYVPEKGVGLLLEAYEMYRRSTDNPWSLYCAGTGKLQPEIRNMEGVYDLGFIQPDELPDQMRTSHAFILPSLYEPWGVAIQEAAAAGLPVICSDACGASVHLVQDGYSGYIFEKGNAVQLADCMVRMSIMDSKQRESMGDAAHELSRQFRPERWADTLAEMDSRERELSGRKTESQMNRNMDVET